MVQYLIEIKTSHMGERISNQLNLFGYAVNFAQNMFLGKTRAQGKYRNSIKSGFRDKDSKFWRRTHWKIWKRKILRGIYWFSINKLILDQFEFRNNCFFDLEKSRNFQKIIMKFWEISWKNCRTLNSKFSKICLWKCNKKW